MHFPCVMLRTLCPITHMVHVTEPHATITISSTDHHGLLTLQKGSCLPTWLMRVARKDIQTEQKSIFRSDACRKAPITQGNAIICVHRRKPGSSSEHAIPLTNVCTQSTAVTSQLKYQVNSTAIKMTYQHTHTHSLSLFLFLSLSLSPFLPPSPSPPFRFQLKPHSTLVSRIVQLQYRSLKRVHSLCTIMYCTMPMMSAW